MDASASIRQTYGGFRKEWNSLFERHKQIIGLFDELLASKNISLPKHAETKKALEGIVPQTQQFNLEKIAINQKQIQDMMAEAEEFPKKREQMEAEKELETKMQNEKLDLEQKRRKRLLSSGTFKHLQYLESEEWGKLHPTKSPQSQRRNKKGAKTPKALITSLEKELENFEESLQQFNSLQKNEPVEEELLDVGAKIGLSPSDWTTLEPVRRRTRISKCRRFIQQNVSKNNWLSDELQHLMINDPVQEPNNNMEDEDEPQIELLTLEDTKKLMQDMTAKLKILKQQYTDEAKKSLQYRNEVMRVEAEKLDLVDHFTSLIEHKDIELSFLQSHCKEHPEDDLGTTYYDDLHESSTVLHPQEPSPDVFKPIPMQHLEEQDVIDDDADFLELLEQKQKQNEAQPEVDFDLLDLEDEEEFIEYLDKISEKDTQPDKVQDARSLYNKLFAPQLQEPTQTVSEDEVPPEEETPAKPHEEGAAYPYVQEHEVFEEEIDPDLNLDSENDLDWLLEKIQQGSEEQDSGQDITVS